MWYNSMMQALLRSPIHGVISKNFMLISYTGRKSGKAYTTPVNYVQEDGMILVTSFRDRTWWRNLIGGAHVSLLVKGKSLEGVGEAITDETEVARYMSIYLSKVPQMAKYFHVGVGEDGKLRQEDLAQAAKTQLMICIRHK